MEIWSVCVWFKTAWRYEASVYDLKQHGDMKRLYDLKQHGDMKRLCDSKQHGDIKCLYDLKQHRDMKRPYDLKQHGDMKRLYDLKQHGHIRFIEENLFLVISIFQTISTLWHPIYTVFVLGQHFSSCWQSILDTILSNQMNEYLPSYYFHLSSLF